MKKAFLIYTFIISPLFVFPQNTKIAFEGIWKGMISSDPNSTLAYYDLIKSPRILSVTTDKGKIVSLGENMVGFTSKKRDSLTVKDLKSEGQYFCICSKGGKFILCDYPTFSFSDSSYFYSGTDVFEYNKIESMPINILLQLYRLLESDNPDSFKEFTNKEYRSLKNRTQIYKTPKKVRKYSLDKNNVIEVLSEESNWLKIRHYPEKAGKWSGRTIEGWIKKKDVN